MTGQIRDPIETALICRKILRWRDAGVLSQIVFSGWQAEEATDADVIQALRKLGFQVVLSPPVHDAGPGFAWMQKKMLYEGLRLCDPDWFCIKVRTDKSAPMIDPMVEHMAARAARGDAELEDRPANGYAAKVSVFNLVTNWPFSHSDYAFAGLVRDLYRMADCDCSDVAWTKRQAVAEVDWYFNGLKGMDPIVDQFMYDLDHQVFAKRMAARPFSEEDQRDLGAIYPLYARTLALMSQQYAIVRDWPAQFRFPDEKLRRALLGGPLPDQRLGVARVGPKVKLSNQTLLDKVLQDPMLAEASASGTTISEPEVRSAFDRLAGTGKPSIWKRSAGRIFQSIPVGNSTEDNLSELLNAAGKKIFAGNDSVLKHLPPFDVMFEVIGNRTPEPYVLAQAENLLQTGQDEGDAARVQSAVDLMLLLANKRYPQAFWSITKVQQLSTYVDSETFTRICRRVGPYDAKILPYAQTRAAEDATFPFTAN